MASRDTNAGGLCIRQCGATFTSVVFQLLCAVIFLCVCVFAVGLMLEATRITGVTTIPPGLAYVPFRHDDGRFYRL